MLSVLLSFRPFNADQYNGLLKALSVVAGNGITAIKAIQSFHDIINKEIQKEEALNKAADGLRTVNFKPGTALHRRQQKVFAQMFLDATAFPITASVADAAGFASMTTFCSAKFLKEAVVHLQLICARCTSAIKEAAAGQLDER
jgi:hypothetical protein